MKKMDWHSYTSKEVLEILKTTNNGIKNSEINDRKNKYGLNVLPSEKHDGFFMLFLKGIFDPIIIILLITIIFTIIINEYIDALAIAFIILIDLIVGAIQERKAIKNSESLSEMIKVRVRVIREGLEGVVDSEDLVVGDIIILSSGDKVSCDARIIDSENLLIDESTLTGESVGINKTANVISEKKTIQERINMIYAGTSVMRGRCKAIVVSVGINTELGKIANNVSKKKDTPSPLSIRIKKFSYQISTIIIIIGLIISFIMLTKGTSGKEIFISVIALSVSAMPEGLPLALTMALTISSSKLSKKGVIVKKLNSVESLGSCTMIASDKTGTLTKNEQTAKVILFPNNERVEITGVGYNDSGKAIKNIKVIKEDVFHISFLGLINNESILEKKSNNWMWCGDSIDIAFLSLAKKLKVKNNVEIIKKIPYESENKYSAVYYKKNNQLYCTVKGSLEIILNYCKKMRLGNKNININEHLLEEQNKTLASEGFRVIALASGKVNESLEIKNLIFEGMIGFIDPIRKEAIGSINECKKAGIKVIMITGDHPLTAFAIGKELKIVNKIDEVITGKEIQNQKKLGNKLEKILQNKKIFARIAPLEKLEIISCYKNKGEFIAVTGDGVNDAPALKEAHIGISMGSGTDVSKETSKMIIANDNFSSIVEGIKEGRCAYSNIRKIINMLLSCGISEVLFFLLSIIFGFPIPLLAIQLLWINIVTDGLQDMALSFEKAENDIMNKPPRNPKENIIDKKMIGNILVASISMGLIVFFVWEYLINNLNFEVNIARGYIMTLMVFMQNMHVINCRSEDTSCFKYKKKNIFVIISIISSIVLQIILMEISTLNKYFKTTSIPIKELIILFMTSFLIIIIVELYKKLNYYFTKKM